MRRIPWDIILALLAGLGLGLVYSWAISPARVSDSEPRALRVPSSPRPTPPQATCRVPRRGSPFWQMPTRSKH